MDNVKASLKLARLDIPEVVIQAKEDEVIPYEYSLMNALGQDDENHILLPDTYHMDTESILDATTARILAWELGQVLEVAN